MGKTEGVLSQAVKAVGKRSGLKKTLRIAIPLTLTAIPILCRSLPGHLAAAGVYAYSALLMVACAVLAFTMASRTNMRVRLQWVYLTISFALGSLGYLAAVSGQLHLLPDAESAHAINGLSAISYACCLLALTACASGIRPIMRVLFGATTQMLFWVFFEAVDSESITGFADHHLIVSTLTVFYLTLTALTVYLGATDGEEKVFTRVVLLYFVARLVSGMLINLIGYTWLQSSSIAFDPLHGSPMVLFCILLWKSRKNTKPRQTGRRNRRRLPRLRTFAPASGAAAYATVALCFSRRVAAGALAVLALAAVGHFILRRFRSRTRSNTLLQSAT